MLIAFGPHELSKVNVGQQLCFDVVDGFLQGFNELLEIFFIQKKLLLFIGESLALCLPPTLGDGNVIVIGAGRFYIEEIGAFARPNSFGVDSFLFPFVHNKCRLVRS